MIIVEFIVGLLMTILILCFIPFYILGGLLFSFFEMFSDIAKDGQMVLRLICEKKEKSKYES